MLTTLPYRIDPFYRDERGRFVPRPEVTPEPLTMLVESAGATRERVAGAHFLARAIREGDSFRVVISKR